MYFVEIDDITFILGAKKFQKLENIAERDLH